MHPILHKTFGGLTKRYYLRQLFFALLMALFFGSITSMRGEFTFESIKIYLWIITTTLLYPYSRFVYESVIGFVIGDNIFFGNAIFMMIVKMVTMLFCYMLALMIAPIGLLYLYFHHSRDTA